MKNSIKKSISLFSLASLIAGCTSETVLHTQPEGARLYMDGVYKGKTPYTYSDMKIVGMKTPLEFKLDGYETLDTHLSRTQRPDFGAIFGGIFVTFPFLWTLQYDKTNTYMLEPLTTMTTNSETHIEKQ
jgi:PEGA domain